MSLPAAAPHALNMCFLLAPGVPFSLLSLANNCCITDTFQAMQQRFNKLYKRKVYLHHYLQYMEQPAIAAAADTVANLCHEYEAHDNQAATAPVARMKPLGLNFI